MAMSRSWLALLTNYRNLVTSQTCGFTQSRFTLVPVSLPLVPYQDLVLLRTEGRFYGPDMFSRVGTGEQLFRIGSSTRGYLPGCYLHTCSVFNHLSLSFKISDSVNVDRYWKARFTLKNAFQSHLTFRFIARVPQRP